MDLQLKDKTALVLGGGGGLGGVISRTLAAEGVRVAVADIDLAAAETTAKAVREAGSHAIALQWDLGDLSAVDSHISRIEDELGAIDILVNNTGGPLRRRRTARMPHCGASISRAWCCRW